jgi:hypothetical protein
MKKKILDVTDVQWQRLVLFAEHLQTCHSKNYRDIMQYYCTDCKAPWMLRDDRTVSFFAFPFLYIEMANVFNEWEYLSEFGLVVFLPEIPIDLGESIKKFFFGTSSNNNRLYLNCYVPYTQSKHLGGVQLSRFSTPRDVSRNIISLLNLSYPNWSMRTVLVEKCRTKV